MNLLEKPVDAINRVEMAKPDGVVAFIGGNDCDLYGGLVDVEAPSSQYATLYNSMAHMGAKVLVMRAGQGQLHQVVQ